MIARVTVLDQFVLALSSVQRVAFDPQVFALLHELFYVKLLDYDAKYEPTHLMEAVDIDPAY